MSSKNVKSKIHHNLTNLVDRRTFITLVVVVLLFILAWRGVGVTAAIEAMAFVSVALVGSNAAQRGVIAWAKRKGDMKWDAKAAASQKAARAEKVERVGKEGD